MCLRITDDAIDVGVSDEVVVYKKLWHDPGHPREDWYRSCMYDHDWVNGENISSRESVELTPEEIESGIVEDGFHFYIESPDSEPANMVVAMQVDTGDIVALGRDGFTGELCLVATKAIFKIPES